MKAGQFVIGIIDGKTRSYQTEGVEKLLIDEEFNKLWRLSKPGVWLYVNPKERVVARSVVTEANDGKYTGRKGAVNHTVIIKFDASTVKDGCVYQIDTTSIDRTLAENTTILTQSFPDPLTQPLPDIKAQRG